MGQGCLRKDVGIAVGVPQILPTSGDTQVGRVGPSDAHRSELGGRQPLTRLGSAARRIRLLRETCRADEVRGTALLTLSRHLTAATMSLQELEQWLQERAEIPAQRGPETGASSIRVTRLLFPLSLIPL